MEMEKVAKNALARFRHTYRVPSDIEKAFKSTIKKIVARQEGKSSYASPVAERGLKFAEEVHALMPYVTVDVIRSRISSDSTWHEIAAGSGISTKKEEFHYKKLMVELMKVLINMQHQEYKRHQKALHLTRIKMGNELA